MKKEDKELISLLPLLCEQSFQSSKNDFSRWLMEGGDKVKGHYCLSTSKMTKKAIKESDIRRKRQIEKKKSASKKSAS